MKTSDRILGKLAGFLIQQIMCAQFDQCLVDIGLHHTIDGFNHFLGHISIDQISQVSFQQPFSKPRDRRQRYEGLKRGHFLLQFLDHIFNQEVAECDARQSRVAIANRVKNNGIHLLTTWRYTLLNQQRRNSIGEFLGQGNFHKHQWIVLQGRMKKCEAASIFPQAIAKVIPTINLMNRLIINNFFQHQRRR